MEHEFTFEIISLQNGYGFFIKRQSIVVEEQTFEPFVEGINLMSYQVAVNYATERCIALNNEVTP